LVRVAVLRCGEQSSGVVYGDDVGEDRAHQAQAVEVKVLEVSGDRLARTDPPPGTPA
jgi:hypothetical protein